MAKMLEALNVEDVDLRRGTNPELYAYECTYREYSDRTFEGRVLIRPEEEGGYSVVALRLRGVVSEGDTVDEAVENIREAFAGAVADYLEHGEEIPWGNVEVDRCPGCIEKWIVVDV